MGGSSATDGDDVLRLRTALATPVRTPFVSVAAAFQPADCSAGHVTTTVATDSNPFVRLGCLAKLLTAELAIEMASAGLLHLDEPAAPADSAARDARIRSITIRHLLEHTHGLDDSVLDGALVDADGMLDERSLWKRLSGVPLLASPGEIYSYGHAGAWLVAALIERRTGRTYSAILRDFLCDRIACESMLGDATFVCPASGNALEMQIGRLLDFVWRRAIGTKRLWPTTERPGALGWLHPLPGWNPFERAVHLGWKAHGGGWFGHASTWPGASALVRVNPRRRLAFVVASGTASAAAVAARIFGGVFPELFDPRPVGAVKAYDSDEQLTGRYERSAVCAHIEHNAGNLRMRIVENGEQTADMTLRAARGVFFCEPPLPLFPYVQFLHDRGGVVRYLWNGRFVLPKNA